VRLYTVIVCSILLAAFPARPLTASLLAQQQTKPADSGSTKIDPAKEADIRKLMGLVGVETLAKQTMDRMTRGLKPLVTNAMPPGEYREQLVNLFYAKFESKMDVRQLLDLAVPIYDRYFSHEEIKGLIQFYQTPLGQKAISALPKLTAEMAEAGRTWGEQLGRESMQEVLAEHPDLAHALEAAGKPQQHQ